jgi:hypothetical protein
MYQYTAHPGYAPLANTHHFNPNDPNYCTTKAAVDHDTVGQSMSENLYTQFGQSVQGVFTRRRPQDLWSMAEDATLSNRGS